MYIITISFVELYKLNLQVPPATINDTNLSRIFNIEAMFDCIVPFQFKKREKTLKKRGRKLWRKIEGNSEKHRKENLKKWKETLKNTGIKIWRKEEGNSEKKEERNTETLKSKNETLGKKGRKLWKSGKKSLR